MWGTGMERKPSEIITDFLNFLESAKMNMNLLMRMLEQRKEKSRHFFMIWNLRQTKMSEIKSLHGSSRGMLC